MSQWYRSCSWVSSFPLADWCHVRTSRVPTDVPSLTRMDSSCSHHGRWPIESAVVVDSGRYLSTVTCLGFYTWPHPSCQVTPAFRGSKLTFRMTSQNRLVIIATSLLQELKSLRLAGREWGRSSITLRSECVSPFSHNKIKICVANEQ